MFSSFQDFNITVELFKGRDTSAQFSLRLPTIGTVGNSQWFVMNYSNVLHSLQFIKTNSKQVWKLQQHFEKLVFKLNQFYLHTIFKEIFLQFSCIALTKRNYISRLKETEKSMWIKILKEKKWIKKRMRWWGRETTYSSLERGGGLLYF